MVECFIYPECNCHWLGLSLKAQCCCQSGTRCPLAGTAVRDTHTHPQSPAVRKKWLVSFAQGHRVTWPCKGLDLPQPWPICLCKEKDGGDWQGTRCVCCRMEVAPQGTALGTVHFLGRLLWIWYKLEKMSPTLDRLLDCFLRGAGEEIVIPPPRMAKGFTVRGHTISVVNLTFLCLQALHWFPFLWWDERPF